MAEFRKARRRDFTWRRALHKVVKVEGPERIAMEWWRDAAAQVLTRDYFRVEDGDGRRFWIFRDGLFGRETRDAALVHARIVCVMLLRETHLSFRTNAKKGRAVKVGINPATKIVSRPRR